jgi:hypothetical protein
MTVLCRMEQQSVTDSTSPFLTGFIDVEIDEQRLAADVLCRLTEVRTMAITRRPDDYPRPRNYRWSSYTVFEKMPLLQEQFQSVPGLNRLESFSLALGLLDWKIVTLPCLKTLCLGNAAYVALPLDKSILHE